ncbi:MAG: tRNA (adenosine(37)-N6)-threonylcarbamoyltransferase complex dimerization subunit type 1 TsaB [Bacilli bacterium]|nr:tRNA (adenosine(37)-N6)-threonylcarbamoyltransferase complex dimerization subunit type 1 TsaB [Bacilli bacterium]
MKVLFIDTHLFDINIMLFDNYQIVSERHIVGEKHNSRFLLPSIKNVCDGNEFDEIVVVNGPGSFTGVRLGVTVAKTLAYTLNKPIKSISSLDIMNYSSDDNAHIFSISDGNGYFIGEYNQNSLVKEYYYLSNNDYQQFSNSNNVETDVTIDYEKVLKALQNREPENPHSVNPIYIKLIGVENDKKNK